MTGILSAGWANFFTRATNYEIDFSNFGRSITTKGVRGYSTKQILDRAFIWGGIIVGGISGYYLNQLRNEESGNPTIALAIFLGVTAGFGCTHYQVTKQRISFRTRMIEEMELIKEGILTSAKNTNAEGVIAELIHKVLQLESVDESKAVRAMRTLCLRKQALMRIQSKLKESEMTYWENDANFILSDLNIENSAESTSDINQINRI